MASYMFQSLAALKDMPETMHKWRNEWPVVFVLQGSNSHEQGYELT